jgi:hypothetical protein
LETLSPRDLDIASPCISKLNHICTLIGQPNSLRPQRIAPLILKSLNPSAHLQDPLLLLGLTGLVINRQLHNLPASHQYRPRIARIRTDQLVRFDEHTDECCATARGVDGGFVDELLQFEEGEVEGLLWAYVF